MIAVLLVVSFLVFALGSLVRGNIAAVIVGSEGATKSQYAKVAQELGLNQSFVVQYWHWLSHAVAGDLGRSPISGRSVASALMQEVPVTGELALLGTLASILIGIPAGLVAAASVNTRLDKVLRLTLLIAFSVPVFIIGVLLLLVVTRLVPHAFLLSYVSVSHGVAANLRSMALPLLTIAASQIAAMMQITRGAVLEDIFKPYVTTAHSVGVGRGRIYGIHVLRNALSPIMTYAGFQFGVMLGSLIVVEQIFNLPGLGRGLLAAINSRDYPMVTAITMILAAAFVFVNSTLEIVHPLIDPRQRRV